MCLGAFGWQNVKKLRSILDSTIRSLVKDHRDILCENPETNFTRKCFFTPEKAINTLLQYESKSSESELIDIFDCTNHARNINASFLMCRSKIRPGAFRFLMRSFTENVRDSGILPFPDMGYDGPVLLCDGSSCNIALNPKDSSTFVAQEGKKGYNQIHLNVLYDLCTKAYMSAHIQGIHNKHERSALVKMIAELKEEKKAHEKSLIIADRGYESYNVFAACIEAGNDFLVRLKDIDSNGILAHHIGDLGEGEFDKYVSTILTKKQSFKDDRWKSFYTVLPARTDFDFFDRNGEYTISFRVVRFLLPSGDYETVATSLDRTKYEKDTLKHLYCGRWDVESAFRKLKCTLGMAYFHSWKMKYLYQEVFARLTLFNFVSFATDIVRDEMVAAGYLTLYEKEDGTVSGTEECDGDVGSDESNEYKSDLAFAQAVTACRKLLKSDWRRRVKDVVQSIGAHTYRIKRNRSFPRNVKPRSYKPFNHRVC